jgi:hypothetical protein
MDISNSTNSNVNSNFASVVLHISINVSAQYILFFKVGNVRFHYFLALISPIANFITNCSSEL